MLTARQDSADRDARRASIAAGVGVAGSIVLILLFTGYLTRVIVRPLRRAARMADQIAGGDLRARMREDDVGEIGALGHSFNAMAGSLEASEGDLRRLVEQQSALRRVATLVARAVPSAEVFEAVTGEVGLLSGADLARLERYETDGTVTGIAAWSQEEGELAVGTRIALEGVSIAALVLQTGRPVRVDSFEDALGPIAEEARLLGIRSSVGCPIVVAGRLWGVIAASSRGEAPFPAYTESRIGEFTDLVATALANAESRAELSRLAEEQSALRRVATLVARRVDPAQIFTTVAEEVQHLFGADGGAVTRFEPNGGSLIAVASGATGAFRPGTRWAPDDTQVTTAVFRTGRPARVDRDCDETATEPLVEHGRPFTPRSTVASPIAVGGRLWGALVIWARPDLLTPDAEERMVSFTELVATAIADAESRAELSASRARIVATADETRRRIERDLHDGTQQRLVSLGLELRLAQSMVPPSLPELEEEIGRVADELDGAVDDLREISRGIHPAILSEGGLAPALRTLARRSAIPVELDVRVDARLPQEAEVAAYYVVSEALTNTAKHARASRADVAAEQRNGILYLSIRDDGVGGADPAEGSGLIGLRDRVEALGGTIDVSSPAGEGTLVMVELPVRPDLTDRPNAREVQSATSS